MTDSLVRIESESEVILILCGRVNRVCVGVHASVYIHVCVSVCACVCLCVRVSVCGLMKSCTYILSVVHISKHGQVVVLAVMGLLQVKVLKVQLEDREQHSGSLQDYWTLC